MKTKAYAKTIELIKAAGKEVPETLTIEHYRNLVMWYIQRWGIANSTHQSIADKLIENPLLDHDDIMHGVVSTSWCSNYYKQEDE